MSATNPTFGEIRHQCQIRWPGVGLDLLDSWINERYRRILRRGDWKRSRIEAVLQTVAPYSTGTVAITTATTNLTLTSGTWTSGMTGRKIRIAARNEYYTFTYASASTGTIDRNYEGDTATEAAYSIWQNIYALPAACRNLRSMRVFSAAKDMDEVSQESLDEYAAARLTEGTPDRYALHEDDSSSPPVQQVELYPIPDEILSIAYWYSQDPTLFSATATILPAWLNPSALYHGVEAEALRKAKDYAGSDRAEALFLNDLNEMFIDEARRTPPVEIKMAPRHTAHRVRRWNRTRVLRSKI
jgi:hypothetical protein